MATAPEIKGHAATYARSSKDRGDVSIDAQERELDALAAREGLAVVARFSDAVEQANDVNRPGFREMVRSFQNPARGWDTVLVLDTSRLARLVVLAETVKHEAKKRGIRIRYAKLPEVNPIVDLLIVQILQAFDQVHSMMSREKGLAGMAENVRQGFRAGGRAPFGFRLEHTATGVVREGEPVRKSKLVPGEDSAVIGKYLKGRALGRSRPALCAELHLGLSASTLIGIEWQALTYAGHTVWNVHAARDMHGGYEEGIKRRPRSEWLVTRNTHVPLITDDEAEKILRRLESTSGRRMRNGEYLLSGLLVTPEGRPWHGNSGFYRAGKANVAAASLEEAIVAKLCEDLGSPEFSESVLRQARAAQQPKALQAEVAAIDGRLSRLNQQIARVANLIAETATPRPLIAKLEELERERVALSAKHAGLKAEHDAAKGVTLLTPQIVSGLLQDIVANIRSYPREQLKDFLRSVVSKISLSKTRKGAVSACLDYEIPAFAGDKVASPRGFEPLLSP